ncbi:hypothetical protein Gotur_024774 [Gossypium turneri]
METELAQLSLNEEEEEILQAIKGHKQRWEIISFTLANLWHPICRVQIRDLGEKGSSVDF